MRERGIILTEGLVLGLFFVQRYRFLMVAKAKRGELNLDRTIWALRGAAGAVRSPADFSEHRRYQ